jgi:hypothetical protein
MAKRKISMCPMLLAVIVVLAWMPTLAGAKTRYLKNNIHYQERADLGGKTVCRASYANYVDPGQGHKVLPVNTTVEIKLTRGWRGRQLTITKLADGTLIHLEYNERNMKIPMKDYIGIISSSKKVSLKQRNSQRQSLQGDVEKRCKNGFRLSGQAQDAITGRQQLDLLEGSLSNDRHNF